MTTVLIVMGLSTALLVRALQMAKRTKPGQCKPNKLKISKIFVRKAKKDCYSFFFCFFVVSMSLVFRDCYRVLSEALTSNLNATHSINNQSELKYTIPVHSPLASSLHPYLPLSPSSASPVSPSVLVPATHLLSVVDSQTVTMACSNA